MTKSLKPKGLIAAFIPDVNDPQTTNPRRFVVFISGFSASGPYNLPPVEQVLGILVSFVAYSIK